MRRLPRHPVLFATGALLLNLALGGSAPVQAQLMAAPESLSVVLAQGTETERVLTLTNAGSGSVSFCLNFERPLQRAGANRKLSETTVGTACGEIGEILLEIDRVGLPGCCSDPYGLAMTPAGRLFAAEQNAPRATTIELTPELEVVRSFEHPAVAEVSTFPETRGVAYDPETGRLWWLNIEEQGQDFRRALLLEGDLDGIATGRRIELPPLTGDGGEELRPSRLSYDPAAHRYYFMGFSDADGSTIWAVDTLGTVEDGYPVRQNAYPGAISSAVDAHGGMGPSEMPGEPEAVRLEMTVNPPGRGGTDRFIVVDSTGADLHIETPLPDVSGGTAFGSFTGELLRSRIDPNGLLYFAFTNLDTEGIVGIRPHPLPPSWLALSAWDGTLGPGEAVEVTLTFSSGTRTVGNSYTAALQVFEAETGNAIEIPLSFEVVPKTDAEDGAEIPSEALRVYPNPFEAGTMFSFGLDVRGDVRLAVYDVLGREVAVLLDGPVEAGTHDVALDARGLAAGTYVYRLTVGDVVQTGRVTLVR